MPLDPAIRRVKLLKSEKDGLGISIIQKSAYSPVSISKIVPNGPADQSSKLFIGDAIVSINNVYVTHMTMKQVSTILRQVRVGETVNLYLVSYKNTKYLQKRNSSQKTCNDASFGQRLKQLFNSWRPPVSTTRITSSKDRSTETPSNSAATGITGIATGITGATRNFAATSNFAATGMAPSNFAATGMAPSNSAATGMAPSNSAATGMAPSNFAATEEACSNSAAAAAETTKENLPGAEMQISRPELPDTWKLGNFKVRRHRLNVLHCDAETQTVGAYCCRCSQNTQSSSNGRETVVDVDTSDREDTLGWDNVQ
ncbi:hypothetical protein Ahia01_000499700, partial [Argonauta hians]